MNNKSCKVYDENIVTQIMKSTALAVAEYLRTYPQADAAEVWKFVECTSDNIIRDTLENLMKKNRCQELRSDSEEI